MAEQCRKNVTFYNAMHRTNNCKIMKIAKNCLFFPFFSLDVLKFEAHKLHFFHFTRKINSFAYVYNVERLNLVFIFVINNFFSLSLVVVLYYNLRVFSCRCCFNGVFKIEFILKYQSYRKIQF